MHHRRANTLNLRRRTVQPAGWRRSRVAGIIAAAAFLAGCAVNSGHSTGGSQEGAGTGGSTDLGGSGASNGFDPGEGGNSGFPPVNDIHCPPVAQEILVLDFRSGWWSGGGGGSFHEVALPAMVEVCPDIAVEYHHFEVDFRIKCLAAQGTTSGCQNISYQSSQLSSAEVEALFEKPQWDDYTQVWILSGSVLDAADVSLSGTLFHHFLDQSQGSCIPVFVGAGDGFIDHGNTVTAELGLGNVFSTVLPMPGFFSMEMSMPANSVGVSTRLHAGAELQPHVLFSNVESIADVVTNVMATARGDSLTDSAAYHVIAVDSGGKPAIAVGEIELPGDDDRPVVFDAGLQRIYAIGDDPGTLTYLQNLVQYLGLVGCKADPPK